MILKLQGNDHYTKVFDPDGRKNHIHYTRQGGHNVNVNDEDLFTVKICMYSHSANGKATPENGFATCSVNLQIDFVTCEVK